MTIDHIKPQSKTVDPQKHNLENLVIACKSCNSAKGDKVFTEVELNQFKERRQTIRKRDEEWVANRYLFINEAISKGLKIEEVIFNKPEFIAEIMKEMKNDSFFQQPKEYDKSQEYIEFLNSGNLWYFNVDKFSLQPFFIYDLERKGNTINTAVDLALESLGYFKGNIDFRTKLLKPFFDIQEGIKIIKTEVLLVNKIWDSIK